MKQIRSLIALLLLLCVILCGCDLRNRQSSEDFVPTGDVGAYEPPRGEDAPGAELNPGEAGMNRVKTVLSERGEYIYAYPAIEYSYELPFIDLAGAHAVGCNQEIESRFGQPIRESLAAMEQKRDPVVKTVAYTNYIFGNVLTLRVERTDTDGTQSEAIYSVDAKTGEKVSAEAFCEAVGLKKDQLKERVQRAAEERLRVLSGTVDSENPDYLLAVTQTMSLLSNVDYLNLYLNPDGKLVCIAEIFTPSGGDGMEELILN